jgi:hypothetical protein
MYLKRVDGPRQVTLPDGTILSRADLAPARNPPMGGKPQGHCGAGRDVAAF